MVVYYDSRTGNVGRFVNKLKNELGDSLTLIKIDDDIEIVESGHLITYTTRVGCIPDKTIRFLNKHNDKIITASTSGNTNWGSNFGLSLDKILVIYPDIKYGIKFELSGLMTDVKKYIDLIK